MNDSTHQPQPEPFPEQDFVNPERDTIKRALAGDPAAFEELVYLYGRRLYAVAYGVVQDASEAEDIVQETFLKAYSRRWLIRDPDKFPAWLFRTTRNRACDLLRKHRPAPLPPEEHSLDHIADPGVTCPSANLRAAERNGAIHRLLDTLPDNHRIAVTLRFMEDMDYRQIEETMGIQPGTVRGILARAMKTLRKGIGALDDLYETNS
jgi:RNA polymerase sigma-70 factor (ECF subfamily)